MRDALGAVKDVERPEDLGGTPKDQKIRHWELGTCRI